MNLWTIHDISERSGFAQPEEKKAEGEDLLATFYCLVIAYSKTEPLLLRRTDKQEQIQVTAREILEF